jgi:hypothetical protein
LAIYFLSKPVTAMHESHQELIELVPEKIIAWRVTKSHLSFLQNPNEWEGTTIRLGIGRENGQARVAVTHEGLVPEIECFWDCAAAWEQYMENLRKRLD